MTAVDGHEELLARLAGLFLDSYADWMAEIRQAVNNDDAESLGDSAHRLKSAVGSIAAKGAFEAAVNLETISRRGEMSQAREACEMLEKEISGLARGLENLLKEADRAGANR